MNKPLLRTITLGLEEAHPLTAATLQQASRRLNDARQRFSTAGYEVQTVRISTRPVFDDLADWSGPKIVRYASELQERLSEYGLGFCSLGPAQASRPEFPLERIAIIGEILLATSNLNLTVQLADQQHGVREEAALPIARLIKRLASETPEGFGNFNFAALACVLPGTPFFPAAYHSGPASLSLGLQGASIVRAVAQESGTQQPTLEWLSERVKTAYEELGTPIARLGEDLAREYQIVYGGIDTSPAPMGTESIVEALEAFGYGLLGRPGTVALTAALTRALKGTNLRTCGYCGLMLPVLEDARLSKRWEEGQVSTHELLLYSTVCGTGLDTIPLPGETSETEIARLLLDVATLAWRFNKPLSARLFPVPGKKAGEYTSFSSPYLTNTLLR